jgi:hypothetical protein
MTALPPLEEREGYSGQPFYVDVLVPGFVEASCAHQFGYPTMPGTRLPTYAQWMWEYLDKPEEMGYPEGFMTREKIIAAYAFEQGIQWQRSRKRRKRMEETVAQHWERANHRYDQWDYQPGDETV